ncbi:MAG: FAD-dependent oxidoreductase [Bacteroidota bacterium]
MTRKEFVKMCGVLGLGMPLQMGLSSCSKETTEPNASERIIIIGAGAAGLSAGYLLRQQGIDFQILEASAIPGGRMKRTVDFVDFPIPLGAEWLHVGTDVFGEIVNDDSQQISLETKAYDPAVDYGLFGEEEWSIADVGFESDRKFINSTWFDFFDQYILPSIQDKIRYNSVVQSIDYGGDQVRIQTANEEFVADKLIITIPLKMLQTGAIAFSPGLPDRKQQAIDQATVWDGCKAFIEFSEKFYPAFTVYDIQPETAGQKLYYDAAYGQNSNRHVMGLFAVGIAAQEYISLTDAQRKEYMLNELDEQYDQKASAHYVQHIFQNWNAEPFINGAYLYDHEDWRRVEVLAESVDNKLFFAGEAYGFSNDWGGVHVAARAAKRAVEELVG